jgi:hypothetical protein
VDIGEQVYLQSYSKKEILKYHDEMDWLQVWVSKSNFSLARLYTPMPRNNRNNAYDGHVFPQRDDLLFQIWTAFL